MRAVNLLPRDAQMRKSFRDEDPAVVVGSALAVVVAIGLGVGFMTAHSHATAEQQKLAAARAELGRVGAELKPVKPVSPTTKSKKPARPIVPVPAVTAEEQPRLDALSQALSTRIAWDRVLREFSLVVPSDVTVSSLNMTAPPDPSSPQAGSSTASGFALSGLAWSHDSVARLLARLMLIPDLDNVTLASSVADARTGQVTFQINADVKGATVAAPVTPAAAVPPATTTGATS
jgi:Tfp pilus assembly protein PilN